MKRVRTCAWFVWVLAQVANALPVAGTSIHEGWVTVAPPEFQGAINNPLKGFRDYKRDGYGLLKRQYIKWSDIEVSADDTVERIIAHTKKITEIKGRRFEELNIKLVPRVYLDWDGTPGKQHWRYWNLQAQGHGLEKQMLTDGPSNSPSRVIRVTGDFNEGSSLNHTFGKGAKLAPGHYRFACRVRGTPGQAVEFELADGWRTVSKEAKIALTEQWLEHSVTFEIKTAFKDETTLRFRLPSNAKGTFDLTRERNPELLNCIIEANRLLKAKYNE